MPTLNLNDPHVKIESLTVEEIRADTNELHEKVYGWLDEGQGEVFTGKHQTVFLVIEISN